MLPELRFKNIDKKLWTKFEQKLFDQTSAPKSTTVDSLRSFFPT